MIKSIKDYLYLSGFIPNEWVDRPKSFSKKIEIYDSHIGGYLEYLIEYKRFKKWTCYVNGTESNIENVIDEFDIKRIENLRFIYLIRAENSDTYKIGRTKYLSQRSKDFSVNLPFKTKLISWYIGDKNEETKFHEYFKEKRINGEWFILDSKDVFVFNSFYLKMINK